MLSATICSERGFASFKGRGARGRRGAEGRGGDRAAAEEGHYWK